MDYALLRQLHLPPPHPTHQNPLGQHVYSVDYAQLL